MIRMARAYYNEIEPFAAAWLRNLIAAGHIAPGDVDERDIRDVAPSDLAGYTQHHFFAGIGVWSYALRAAGWPDSRRVWTGSCPCQPFSSAGRGGGFADERHLWPHFFYLQRRAKPRAVPVFGEQVASKDGLAWLDLVQSDLEGEGYAVGAADLCAAGVGAPHIRQRMWWVADADGGLGRQGCEDDGWRYHRSDALEGAGPRGDVLLDLVGDDDDARLSPRERAALVGARRGQERRAAQQPGGTSGGLGDARLNGDRQHARELHRDEGQYEVWPAHGDHAPVDASAIGRLADADRATAARQREHSGSGSGARWLGLGPADSSRALRGGPVNGPWRDADWLFCRDGKWRPVEPGTSPLAHGAASRVGRLRAYGNAIVAQAAEAWISAYLDRECLRLTPVSDLAIDNAGGVFA